MNLALWIIVMLVFVVAAGFTRAFAQPRSRFYLLDRPNERSLHDRPVPRSGGLAILGGVVLGMVLTAWHRGEIGNLFWLLLGGLLVATVSYLDDRRHIPVIWRLAVHMIAAGLLLWAGYSLRNIDIASLEFSLPVVAGGALSLIFIVWMINLYNFMDGMDGFAGGMTVVGFASFAVLGLLSGNAAFFSFNIVVSVAALGFLVFNFPPARIFMGDVGSSTLGFLAAAMSLWAARARIFPFWVALLVFSPFIVDATVTLSRRLIRGEKVWQAHKSHYYQRLVEAGWGHRKTVLWEYVLMAACGLSALLAPKLSLFGQWLMIFGWALIYSVLMMLANSMVSKCKAVKRP